MGNQQLVEDAALAIHAIDCGCVVNGQLEDPRYTRMAEAALAVFEAHRARPNSGVDDLMSEPQRRNGE